MYPVQGKTWWTWTGTLAHSLRAMLNILGQKNNALVSGNAGDEKILHPGGRKETFFINLVEF